MDGIEFLFRTNLLMAALLSFYMSMCVLFFNHPEYYKIYSNWQFVTLAAVSLDVWFVKLS